MMELRPSSIASATGGAWLRTPSDDAPLAGVSIDSREPQAGTLFIAIRGETHDGHDFASAAAEAGARMLMVEREIDLRSLPDGVGVMRMESTRTALMQLAARYRQSFAETTVIAITGSSGKTTTRQMIHAALGASLPGVASPKSFNNDIGVPLSLLTVRPEHRYAVIEVGINAVGEMQPLADVVRPDIAIITNIGESHLEGLGDVATVAREKMLLTSTLTKDGLAILHADSRALRDAAGTLPRIIWFGESPDAEIRLADRGRDDHGFWLSTGDGARFRLALPGRHNAINALSAIAVGRQLGLADDAISAGLEWAVAPPMRMEAESVGGILAINDAYNANPQSMLAGIETFLELTADRERRVLVLGDMCELGAAGPALHEALGRRIGERLAHAHVAHVVCVGELASTHLAEGLRQAAAHLQPSAYSAMNPATADEIAKALKHGDAVFIKGSRAMALEQLVPAIERRFALELSHQYGSLGVTS